MAGKPLVLLDKCQGLHTGMAGIRVKYDHGTGATFLEACQNVVVGRGGRLSRRVGAVQKNAQASLDIFSDGIDCLVHTAGALYRLNTDFTLTGLRSGLTVGLEMFFAASPDGIYYNNGIERGKVVRLGASYPWVKPTTDYSPVNKLVAEGPPRGMTHIHYHNGRVLCAVGKAVFFSDYRSYNVFYPERDMLQFPDFVQGFASARRTAFVFTETGVYSYVGNTLGSAEEIVASNLPAIPGTVTTIKSTKSEFNTLPMWLTRRGIYVGLPDGSARVVSGDRLILPDGVFKGKAVCHNGEYIAILQR